MSETIHAIMKELRRRLEALYGPRLVRMLLYGSQARGEAEPGSDIDVLVVLEGPVAPGEEIARTSDIIAALSLKHGVVLSRAFVSSDRFEHEQSPLLRNIRREGVVV
jgi:predicted nucleotidyltransferase